MRTRHPIIVVASVLALALAVSVVLAASARATFPGRNGLITFATPSGKLETSLIFVMNPDGSGLRQVVHGVGVCETPVLSPDGTTIAFARLTAAGNVYGAEISAMTTTGADQRHLASAWCEGLCFSPDGKQVVFVNDPQVWLMNADGSHQRRLTGFANHIHADRSPSYSPDGKTIVFTALVYVGLPSAKVRGEILAMNPDGTHLRRLAYTTGADWTANSATPGVSFSPDGKTIVYSAYASKTEAVIRVMNADGTHQRLLPRSYGFTWPCFSPDGRQILCVNGHHQISVVGVNGTHWRRLTSVSWGIVMGPDWGPHVR